MFQNAFLPRPNKATPTNTLEGIWVIVLNSLHPRPHTLPIQENMIMQYNRNGMNTFHIPKLRMNIPPCASMLYTLSRSHRDKINIFGLWHALASIKHGRTNWPGCAQPTCTGPFGACARAPRSIGHIEPLSPTRSSAFLPHNSPMHVCKCVCKARFVCV